MLKLKDNWNGKKKKKKKKSIGFLISTSLKLLESALKQKAPAFSFWRLLKLVIIEDSLKDEFWIDIFIVHQKLKKEVKKIIHQKKKKRKEHISWQGCYMCKLIVDRIINSTMLGMDYTIIHDIHDSLLLLLYKSLTKLYI